MIQVLTQKIINQLKKNNLPLEDKSALLSAIQDKLKILPLEDSLIIEPNKITIRGNVLDIDQIIKFKDSCMALKENYAFNVIREQVKYLAVNLGIYKSTSMEDLIFYKAALFNINQEDLLLDKII